MEEKIRRQAGEVLVKIAKALDIPDSKFEEAEKHYKAVGRWLSEDTSPLKPYNPDIYLQGSFLLGTVVKPINEKDDYDIDLVCELNRSKTEVSQKDLKEKVGDRLKENGDYKRMLDDEGKRCWTLIYADGTQFHMDVLPSIPNAESFRQMLAAKGFREFLAADDYSDTAIAITDRERYNYEQVDDDWLTSNPRGYAKWFRGRMQVRFDERRRILAEEMKAAKVDDVPAYKVKTPLQRSVQILKRHRDIYFKDKPELKPASIIITTLAAHAYNNEGDLIEALLNIVNGMEGQLGATADGVAVVLNPVNPAENFADRWKDKPWLQDSCKAWLVKVKADIKKVLEEGEVRLVGSILKESFGEGVVKAAMSGMVATGAPAVITQPRKTVEIREPVKPWRADVG